MKRVFEGIVFERRRIGDNAIGACTTEAFEEFYQSLPIGKATRITAEDLPESKPEPCDENAPCWVGECPHKVNGLCHAKRHDEIRRTIKPEEKNCGNCAIDYKRCTQHERKYGCDAWQPKAAEPQGWEQRFDKEFPHCGGAFKTSIKAFIRAEIERVRLEERNRRGEGGK